MPGIVVWVKAEDEDPVPIKVRSKGKKPLRVGDLAEQCEGDMGLEEGKVVVMHEGVTLPGGIHLSLVNPEAVLELDVVGGEYREGSLASLKNSAEEICRGGSQPYPQVDSPCSVENAVERSREDAGLQPVFFDRVFGSPSTVRESSASPVPVVVKRKQVVVSKKKKDDTKKKTPVAAKKRAPKSTNLSVEAAYQAGKLDAVPTAQLSTFLADRGLSGMGSRKALLTRIERFGPVIVKAACFAEVGMSQEF